MPQKAVAGDGIDGSGCPGAKNGNGSHLSGASGVAYSYPTPWRRLLVYLTKGYFQTGSRMRDDVRLATSAQTGIRSARQSRLSAFQRHTGERHDPKTPRFSPVPDAARRLTTLFRGTTQSSAPEPRFASNTFILKISETSGRVITAATNSAPLTLRNSGSTSSSAGRLLPEDKAWP